MSPNIKAVKVKFETFKQGFGKDDKVLLTILRILHCHAGYIFFVKRKSIIKPFFDILVNNGGKKSLKSCGFELTRYG